MKTIMIILSVFLSLPVLASSTAPISITDVAQRGLPVLVETTTVDSEMDVPLLTPDGNIVHLLGTAHPRTLPDAACVEVTVHLTGVTQPECVAHVEVLVDATTHHNLAQKLKMTCLGQTIHDAYIHNPPLPPGEGRGEGEVQ